jgi:hypothetical protein
MSIYNNQMDKRTSEKTRSEIVSQLTDSFFLNKGRERAMAQQVETQPEISPSAAMAMAADTPTPLSQTANAEDLDQPAVGRYIDVNV